MEPKTFFDGVAKTLNAGGTAILAAYDSGAEFLKCTLSRVLPGEKADLDATIKEYEARIHNLYVEIGKESARFTEPAEAFAAAQVQVLIEKLREYEANVADALQRLDEIAAEKIAARNAKKAAREEEAVCKENLLVKALGKASARLSGEKSISAGAFRNMTDKEIFERVAHYLLNNETELRVLLIKDLGRAGSKAALPSLIDALQDKDARIKIAVLAALSYIKDATAVDPIIQVLSDDNVDVRARALESIKNITGVQAEFDVHAEGEALKEWIALLKKCLETWVTSVTAVAEECAECSSNECCCPDAEAEETCEECSTCTDESASCEEPAEAVPVPTEEIATPENGDATETVTAAPGETTAIWKKSRSRK
ncbi:MAG TPA: HEAT repeat domain-containing protein [Desulfuromonadales bacterium]|nr:HEAT repeat domain-containing protein [Desulfuromonadales bacterium]